MWGLARQHLSRESHDIHYSARQVVAIVVLIIFSVENANVTHDLKFGWRGLVLASYNH